MEMALPPKTASTTAIAASSEMGILVMAFLLGSSIGRMTTRSNAPTLDPIREREQLILGP
jgi:hypothetical protein